MNNQLLQVYTSKWADAMLGFNPIFENDDFEVKPTNPLLLYIDDEENYETADIRLMIFGQETNGWYDEQGVSIIEVQNLYDKFFNKGECWSYGGQFWNGIKRFVTSLQKKYPDKRIRVIWNNIVKIGKEGAKGMPPNYIYDIEKEFFKVIPKEIEILKPNIVVFFTGPKYDQIIEHNFGILKYEALPNSTERQLSRVRLKNVEFAYRTYHPNYLWRNDIDDYFDTLIEDIKL